MKRLLFLVVLAVLGAAPCGAQVEMPATQFYTWSPLAASGQVGSYLVLGSQGESRPSNYTIDWSVSGTTPVACTFRVEGSSDGVNWYGLDVTSPSTTSCTSSGMESISSRPVFYLRINAVSYTKGDNTTSIVFHWTGGR